LATPVATYGFINAKLRARISKLLDEGFFLSLARAHTFVEAIGQLAGSRYDAAASTYNETGDFKLCELELIRVERATLGGLTKYTPSAVRPFTDAILGQYDVATAKHAIRLWFERTVRGRSIDDKVAYFLRDARVKFDVDAIINAESREDVVAVFAEAPFSAEIAPGLERMETDNSLFDLEIRLDRWYYSHLLAGAKALSRRDAHIASRLIGIQIDLQNVDWVVRIGQYYKLEQARLRESVVPGGTLIDPEELMSAYSSDRPVETLVATLGPGFSLPSPHGRDEDRPQARRLALLEELLRSILFHEIRRALGGYPFTVGVVLAYFLLVQNEVRTLMSVLNAKLYDLNPDRIEGLI